MSTRTGGFADSFHIRSSSCTSWWISFSCYLACKKKKLPEGEEILNEIYVLRRQRDNLCCAAERGRCHIIIKLRCAGQMWGLDNEFYSAASSAFDEPHRQSQESCAVSTNRSMSQAIISLRSRAYLIFAPCDLAFAHRGLHIKCTHVLQQVQAAYRCIQACISQSLCGQTPPQGVSWVEEAWKLFSFILLLPLCTELSWQTYLKFLLPLLQDSWCHKK